MRKPITKTLRNFIRILLISGASGSLVVAQNPAEADSLLKQVDPFIGTGFHGHTFPGATTPFGMVQLSPDTRTPVGTPAAATTMRIRRSGDSATPISAAPASATMEISS
jgi:putative alpha-1,2-mannosidase